MMNTAMKLSACTLLVLSLGACGSMSTREQDTVVGAGVGAAVGAAATRNVGGAAVGGVVGGVIGNEVGKRRD